MKRTTFALDATVLKRLKQRAAAEDRPMQELVNDLLAAALAEKPAKRFTLELTGGSGKLQPGVDLEDRDRLLDLLSGE